MVLSLSCHRSFGCLVDVRLSEKRDMAAAKAFFRSAKAVTGASLPRVSCRRTVTTVTHARSGLAIGCGCKTSD